MRKTQKWDALLLFLTATVLLLGGVGLTFFPAPRFSAAENRRLAAFPTASVHALANGTYTAGLDDYATERVPFRGICRTLNASCALALWRRESHGVILCRDGSLCRRTEINETAFRQNLSALSRLPKVLGKLPLAVAVAPRRIDARSEVLPTLYDTAREQALWQELPAGTATFLDATNDTYWYRTDHHWTSEGAHFAYVRLSRYLGYAPYAANEFTPVTLSKSFLGTSAAAAGFPEITPDTVSVWRYEGDGDYRVLRDGVSAAFQGLYDLAKLREQDQYSLFLGGNCGLLQIDRGEGDERPLLLVVKDSFANTVLPFLARHYRILAVDPRYYAGSLPLPLDELDQVLVLCGMQTLTQTPFFTALLR